MHRFAQRPLSSILLLAALATSNAFLAPCGRRNLLAPSSCRIGSSLDRRRASPLNPTALHQSPGDGDEDGGSSTINIALITTTTADGDDNPQKEALQTALTNHPFCKMTGVRLAVADVPAPSSSASPWSRVNLSRLKNADIACFGTASAVSSYLRKLDADLKVSEDASEEDRRELPNKPDLEGDILGDAPDGAATATLMAACPSLEAARECLNSGRWASNHIYYPKETQGAVELKTEPLRGRDADEGSGEDEVKEEEEEEEGMDIDIEVWAASVVQAAGDVMERKFWGGGW